MTSWDVRPIPILAVGKKGLASPERYLSHMCPSLDEYDGRKGFRLPLLTFSDSLKPGAHDNTLLRLRVLFNTLHCHPWSTGLELNDIAGIEVHELPRAQYYKT